MLNISIDLSEEIDLYKHCEYQAMIAACILSQKAKFIIATVPTGSGKTWIQGLIAKYYCTKGEIVSIVEPNDTLKKQTMGKLCIVDNKIKVFTIEQFYKESYRKGVIILDEYDSLF